MNHVVHKTLKATANPFLEDHIIGANRVFPTVCAVAWMAQAAESVFPGCHFHGLENYQLLKGIVLTDDVLTDDQASGRADIDCKIELAVSPDSDTHRLLVDARVSSQRGGQGLPACHYAARLMLANAPAPLRQVSLELPAMTSGRESGEDAADIYRDGTLFHGESLRGIERILRCDARGLLLACRVPDSASRKQGDFPIAKLNIFACDLIYQAMLVWVRKTHGMGSLPTATREWNVYRQPRCGERIYLELSAAEESARRNQNKFTADIQIVGEDKTLLVAVKGAEVTGSESLKQAFVGR